MGRTRGTTARTKALADCHHHHPSSRVPSFLPLLLSLPFSYFNPPTPLTSHLTVRISLISLSLSLMDNNNNNNKKELMGSNKTAYSPQSWGGQRQEERPIKTASEFFERLNQSSINQVRPDAQRKLTSSEFLEFLRKQGPEGRNTSRSDGNSQSSSTRSQNIHNKERNHNYQTVAIDQCDITSSVDYGSRDYYCPAAHSSDASYTRKENELDDLYNKTCTDTRGNWWEGSFNY